MVWSSVVAITGAASKANIIDIARMRFMEFSPL
jgi:hypothetical protein